MSFCSKCGKPVEGNDKFCASCGAPLEEQNGNSNAFLKTKKGIIVIGAVVVLILVIALGGLKNNKKQTLDNQSGTEYSDEHDWDKDPLSFHPEEMDTEGRDKINKELEEQGIR